MRIKTALRHQSSAAPEEINCSEIPMMDVVMLAIGIVFFALSIGYVYACDRL
jgi:hypothetical protein